MLLRANPHEAYRRVDFDARVHGASPQQLVDLCLEKLVEALDRALYAHRTGDPMLKSASMARATAALTSLILGIDPTNPLGASLAQLYQAARRGVLDSVTRFDPAALATIRDDFGEIRLAMTVGGRG